MTTVFRPALLTLVAATLLAGCNKLDDPSLQPRFDAALAEPIASKSATAYSADKNVFFGDLHIHTGFSTDAYVMGVRSTPEDVYIFAKGGTIEHGLGYPIKISRPLDFAAVTDHSEYLGQARQADLDVPSNRQSLRELLLNSGPIKVTLAWLRSTNFIRENGFGYGVDIVDTGTNKAAWDETIATAERHNQPGIFTAFIGYEWSAFAGEPTIHMHRNVIYRGSNVADIPFSSVDSQRPEDLWQFLEQQNAAGKTSFAIPHNANLSDGKMYAASDSEGLPLTSKYAAMRNRYEPISEILQVKGASETHTLLSPEDEFADFELTSLAIGGATPEMAQVKGGYMRDALRVGIALSHSEGFNPFRFGVIGASDSHNASSPAEEDNYHGKLPLLDGSAGMRTDQATLLPSGLNPVTRWGSGGLAGVWAQENSRASLFDALRSRETFATSGPRMSLRMFAGWQFDENILLQTDIISRAYRQGVAMGGELSPATTDAAPSFLLLASKDPEGANLDRLQIIKGWVDAHGRSHEKVFNVAAGGREVDSDGNLETVGTTVDIETASYDNSIGAASFAAVWIDPQFNPQQQAFYYARLLEIPTPRWSTYDAKALGTEPLQPATIQERAIGSAIWYGGSDRKY